MSEIFSWLKKAAIEKDKSYLQPPVRSLHNSEGRDFETIISDNGMDPSGQNVVRGKIEIPHDARFELAAAERRILSVLDPLTLVGEQYRVLRARLEQLQKQKGTKTLLISSSIPQEGKTFTACCLAGVFAQEPGRRVLLIDADMRKPQVGRSLGVSFDTQTAGLSQVLRGEKSAEQVLLSSATADLYLLPAGPVPRDPAELLSSPSLEMTIKRMAQVFDWVVIDSPPVISLADATLMAPLCDSVLLVVRTGRTPSKLVRESVRRLGKEKICGVVMNRSRPARSSYYYYNYYHKARRP